MAPQRAANGSPTAALRRRYSVLEPVRARVPDPRSARGPAGRAAIAVGGQKQRALLALLLLDAGRVVSVDRLVDALWGERPPRTAPTSLQNFVSQLRKSLGADVLVTRPPGYLLRGRT